VIAWLQSHEKFRSFSLSACGTDSVNLGMWLSQGAMKTFSNNLAIFDHNCANHRIGGRSSQTLLGHPDGSRHKFYGFMRDLAVILIHQVVRGLVAVPLIL
jgi:hypothetical protein